MNASHKLGRIVNRIRRLMAKETRTERQQARLKQLSIPTK